MLAPWLLLLFATCLGMARAGAPLPSKVIVLMMENQSYDRIFGWDPELGDLKKHAFSNKDWEGNTIYVTEGASPQHANGKDSHDPCHAVSCMLDQMYDGAYVAPGGSPNAQGYVKQVFPKQNGTKADVHAEGLYMKFYDPTEATPHLLHLAKTYVTFDRWYCSLPGPTGPNRIFAACSSTGGCSSGAYQPQSYGDGIPLRSIYEQLDEENRTWGVFEWNVRDEGRESLGTVRALDYIQAHSDRVHDFQHFYDILESETRELPDYTWLIPDLDRNSMHPACCNGSITVGDALIGDVYERLKASRFWEEGAALLVTFDESGGFYDSKPPQGLVSAPPVALNASWCGDHWQYDFRTRGPRVPAVLASKHLGHRVDHSVYEHSSIPKSIRCLFAPKQGALSAREAESGDFIHNNYK